MVFIVVSHVESDGVERPVVGVRLISLLEHVVFGYEMAGDGMEPCDNITTLVLPLTILLSGSCMTRGGHFFTSLSISGIILHWKTLATIPGYWENVCD